MAVGAGFAPVAAAEATPHGPGPLPLERLFDNRAVSDDTAPADADFDGAGGSLSAQDLNAAGWTPGRSLGVERARLTWPVSAGAGPDNVRANGQRVRVSGRGDALAFLVAGTGGDARGSGVVRYADGSRSAYTLTAPDWRTGPLATKSVALPHRNTPDGQLLDRTRLYVATVPVRAGRRISSVELPRVTGGAALHVFALSVRAAATGWTGTWSASTAGYTTVGPWADRTVRLVVHTSAGGPRVRIRLDNTFASTPVRIGSASVAVQEAGAAARGAPVPLTFRGARGTQLPAGAQEFSDPVSFSVPADANLLVSFHLPEPVAAAPVHSEAVQQSYVSGPGDHAGEAAGAAYTATLSYWPLLTGVDVAGGPGSVVLLGDSITDGVHSTQGANRRWPNVLATRLLAQRRVPRFGVLNQGISANKVVADRYPGDGISTDTGGVSALHRLDRDVFAQPSVRTVVVFQGVNDVRWGAFAGQVTAGLREIVDRAHARGLKVIGATVTPCEGESLCTAAAEAQRVAVNAYVRGRGSGFDGVLDFDAVVRDPAHPARMRAEFDSGDHLHPGDAGLRALADSVDLRILSP
ncbi:SGNH/GDSL hydrolase family protein [Streptomyces sp. SID14478]|nr:SGNH/GDSL hydrolase family protein [Streptomyces sp. SID14478]NEB80981.1 SGNH/GDSL hydrolase family protein [Streptomyces sp. SID14478]